MQRRNALLNILLHPSQHIGFQYHIQPLYLLPCFEISEILPEVLLPRECIRFQIVQQSPELISIILDGCSG